MIATTEDTRVAELLRRRKLLAQEATQARCGACGSILSDDGSCSGCGSTLHRLDAPPSSKRSKSSAHCPKCTGRINTYSGKCPRCDARPVVLSAPTAASSRAEALEPAPVDTEPPLSPPETTPAPVFKPSPPARPTTPVPSRPTTPPPTSGLPWRPERATFYFRQSADVGDALVVHVANVGAGPYLVLKSQRWAIGPEEIDRLAATLRHCLAQCTGALVDGVG